MRTVNRIPHLNLILMSVAASLVTVGLKFAAYRLTGSVGLLSDAVESTANVVAALTALFALWYGAAPADKTHPYGHEKIDFFSCGVEGGFIAVAAIGIAWEAVRHLHAPEMPGHLPFGMALVAAATAVNFFVGRALVTVGRRVDSLVLEADGKHLLADVWTSGAVILGLCLVALTGKSWIDPVLGLLVAVNIAYTALGLIRRSFDGLMDRALDHSEIRKIRAAIESKLEPDMTFHALRTRRAGARRFADYHLLVPGQCSVSHAHDCEMAIGHAIAAAIPGIEITAHIEPVEEPAAWNDTGLVE